MSSDISSAQSSAHYQEEDETVDVDDNFSSRGVHYDVSLVFEGNVNVEEGYPGSPSSIIFYLMATDVTKNDVIQKGACAVRLEHRTSSGLTLHFHATQLMKAVLNNEFNVGGGDVGDHDISSYLNGISSSSSGGVSDNSNSSRGGHHGRPSLTTFDEEVKKKGRVVCFSTQMSSLDVLRVTT
jgi:hypothetical protein